MSINCTWYVLILLHHYVHDLFQSNISLSLYNDWIIQCIDTNMKGCILRMNFQWLTSYSSLRLYFRKWSSRVEQNSQKNIPNVFPHCINWSNLTSYTARHCNITIYLGYICNGYYLSINFQKFSFDRWYLNIDALYFD